MSSKKIAVRRKTSGQPSILFCSFLYSFYILSNLYNTRLLRASHSRNLEKHSQSLIFSKMALAHVLASLKVIKPLVSKLTSVFRLFDSGVIKSRTVNRRRLASAIPCALLILPAYQPVHAAHPLLPLQHPCNRMPAPCLPWQLPLCEPRLTS